jgi:hypothetical protein
LLANADADMAINPALDTKPIRLRVLTTLFVIAICLYWGSPPLQLPAEALGQRFRWCGQDELHRLVRRTAHRLLAGQNSVRHIPGRLSNPMMCRI